MRELVLIGGGHSHVQILRQHGMRPFDARITLVVDDPVAVYSGMVPGLVAGQYAAHELEIDVRPLARRAGARVIVARAERVDAAAKQVHLAGRPPLRYDLASINVGATVAGTDTPGVREHALPTRPIARLVRELDARLETLGEAPRIVVVGAGAGGIELAFCLDARLRAAGRAPSVTLVFASDRVLPDRHPRIADAVRKAAETRGIALRPGTRVLSVGADRVDLDGGAVLEADLTVWVAGAWPHGLGQASGLPTDDRGYIRVEDTLEVEGCADLFAVGDCAVPRSWPDIPKAGVYAVREGPVLADNLRAKLAATGLSRYRPQSDFFGILNLGDGTAIGMKWGVPVSGAAVFTWKDRIDRQFMDRFQVLDPQGTPAPAFLKGMPPMPEMEMVCGGCAAKVGQTPLTRALARLPAAPPRADVVIGPEQADDVVAWRAGDQLVVQNVDAFTAFTDDPYLVGVAAGHNATSDLYAKGIDPTHAMAYVQIPEDEDPEEALFQVMSGLRAALDPDGVALLGGHTLLGEKLVVGLAVTAVTGATPWPLDGARPGDALVLTRPLGTGVLFHADMAGRAPGRAVQAALAEMTKGNGPASRALREVEVHAATDVTGFGLGRHLAEVLQASRVSATLEVTALPAYPGVLALLASGERSTFHDENRSLLKALRVDTEAGMHPAFELLFDPQTCGGLLVATPEPERVPGVRIGTVTEPRDDGAVFEVVAR
ncbi:MAG: selenide, water dikinase SelD [Alphaproteobacteria bacterium]|nr:selenide, water dikinase SelD [Alphaproteobacteria bacterium]